MFGARIPTHAKKLSNRRRLQLADQLRREGEQAIDVANKVNLILLAVLAQSGGSITVTDGTLQQVGDNLKHLDWRIVDGPVKGESIVKLIEEKDTHAGEGLVPAESHVADDRGAGSGSDATRDEAGAHTGPAVDPTVTSDEAGQQS